MRPGDGFAAGPRRSAVGPKGAHITTGRRNFLRELAAAPLLAGCTATDGPAIVRVGPAGDLVFRPGTNEPLVVPVGTTVRFVWESDYHNVRVADRPSGADWRGHERLEDAGFVHEHTFEVAGTYRYYCVPHRPAGMEGRLVVERTA